VKAQRREQLQKAKDLLNKLTGQVETSTLTPSELQKRDKVQINKANNLIVETTFY
jgi:hypothetical protein